MKTKQHRIYLCNNVPVSSSTFEEAFTRAYPSQNKKVIADNEGRSISLFKTPICSLVVNFDVKSSYAFVFSDDCAKAVSDLEKKLGFKFEEVENPYKDKN